MLVPPVGFKGNLSLLEIRVTRFDILHKGIKAKESVPGLCLSRTCLDLIPSQQHRHPVSCHEAALAYFPALRCLVGGLQDCNPRIRGQALWLTLAMTFLLASLARNAPENAAHLLECRHG